MKSDVAKILNSEKYVDDVFHDIKSGSDKV